MQKDNGIDFPDQNFTFKMEPRTNWGQCDEVFENPCNQGIE